MTVFEYFLHFPHKNFFPIKGCRTEDVRMYFWLKTKMQGKQSPGNSLQSYLFLITKIQNIFTKGYKTNFTEELFKEAKLVCGDPNVDELIIGKSCQVFTKKIVFTKLRRYCKGRKWFY